jgi:hypothetical protein
VVFGIVPTQAEVQAPNRSRVALRPMWVEPRFGPEFTFSRDESNNVQLQTDLVSRCRTHLVDNQPPGQKFTELSNRTLFTSPNGWDFAIGIDQGVVEVKMKPLTVADFEKYECHMQDAIFASAANMSMYPYLYLGGGHINISWDTFENNLPLIRNFIVDMYNHAELSMGIFGYDTHNAVAIQALSRRNQKVLLKLIEKIDNGEAKSVGYVRSELANLHYDHFDDLTREWNPGNPRMTKYYALNFLRLDSVEPVPIRRIEFRAVRAQASMNVFVRQISLLRDRLFYLHNLREKLPIKLAVRVARIIPEVHKLTPPVDPQEAMRAFYVYVKEAGHVWQDHRDYMWPQWISAGELQKFEESDWFKEHECPTILTATVSKGF